MTAPKPEHPDALTAWLDPDSGVLYFSQAGGRNAATYLLKSAVEKRERARRDALAACVEVVHPPRGFWMWVFISCIPLGPLAPYVLGLALGRMPPWGRR